MVQNRMICFFTIAGPFLLPRQYPWPYISVSFQMLGICPRALGTVVQAQQTQQTQLSQER